MTFKRNLFGRKQIVCDGCGLALPVWKAVNWTVSDGDKTFHADCRKRGGGTFTPLHRV